MAGHGSNILQDGCYGLADVVFVLCNTVGQVALPISVDEAQARPVIVNDRHITLRAR